jgi:enamine deaminase RidA (YjgF/YER057c/UK114 family)
MAEARKRVLNPKTVCPPIKPYYSNAVIVNAGPLMFVAGQASLDKAGKVVGAGDLRAQAVQTLENIKAICEAAGATMADIVEVTNYVTDIRAFHDITDIRNRYFPKDGPASVICEIGKLALPELMIEISAVVALPSRAKPAARPASRKKAARRRR